MQANIELLEDKVSSLITLYRQLQNNNLALQEEVRISREKNVELEQKIKGACRRIDCLLEKLPGVEDVR